MRSERGSKEINYPMQHRGQTKSGRLNTIVSKFQKPSRCAATAGVVEITVRPRQPVAVSLRKSLAPTFLAPSTPVVPVCCCCWYPASTGIATKFLSRLFVPVQGTRESDSAFKDEKLPHFPHVLEKRPKRCPRGAFAMIAYPAHPRPSALLCTPKERARTMELQNCRLEQHDVSLGSESSVLWYDQGEGRGIARVELGERSDDEGEHGHVSQRYRPSER